MSFKSQRIALSNRIGTGDRQSFGLLAAAALVWWIAYNSLQTIADTLSYDLLGLGPETRLGSAVNFFLYDVPKILLLLSGMIFLITVLRTFVTPEQTRRWLGGRREGVGNVLASLLGIITPFCSCSAVPLFIGFVESGIPLGVTFSFLVTAPMVNEVALVMLFGMFGWKIAGLYMASGVTLAILSGILIGRLHLEQHVEPFVYQVKVKNNAQNQLEARLTWTERFSQALQSTRDIVGKVWPYVIGGIAVGAGIHGYVPDDFMVDIMGKDAWWSVPAAVILGVPMYSNAAGVIPIVSVLLDKGATLGTVLAFMMAVVALSLPEMIILRRVLRPRLIATYIAVLTVGIIVTGYLFNLVI
ncbi:MAG TPA: permease [Aggregatilinea sp.]|uniref:permease n=1 Tax=Aggregatilinea sp. TaxID=2806333 RepID=UPI002D1A59C2|nr:permease [Aggregatilinea sp.]HML21403.1 permease [Aggregatilinea sp.]